MHFLIYVDSNGMFQIDYSARDEAAGIIGSLRDLPNPIGTAGTHEAVIDIAYADLGRHPSDMLYVADSIGLLYDIVINQPYHDERSASRQAIVVARTCFVLAVLASFATVVLSLGYLGLTLMGASIAIYLTIVRSEFLNEIEAGVVCIILLLLASLVIPAIQSGVWKSQNQTSGPIHRSGEVRRITLERRFRTRCDIRCAQRVLPSRSRPIGAHRIADSTTRHLGRWQTKQLGSKAVSRHCSPFCSGVERYRSGTSTAKLSTSTKGRAIAKESCGADVCGLLRVAQRCQLSAR